MRRSGSDKKGTIIGIALQLDAKKAIADAPGIARQITNIFGTALNSAGGGKAPTLLQAARVEAVKLESQAKATATQLLAQGKAAEASARASKTASEADVHAAKAKAQLASASVSAAKAGTEAARQAELGARATKSQSAAELNAARSSAALAKAKVDEARASALAARETDRQRREEEKAEAARRRGTFGAGFRRGFASTRVNMGPASPILSAATAAGGAGILGAGAATLGATAVAGLAAGLKNGTEDAAALEQELNVLGAQGRVTAAQLESLRKTARELGADLQLPGVSSLDAARAMTALVRPLGDVQAASEGARGALQLAQVANIDVAEAAKISAGGVKAFNLEARDTTRVADVLSRVIAITGDSLNQVAEGFAQSSAAYNQAGFSIEELAQDYAALSQAGIKGSDAGTSLKTSIQRLISPTDEAKKKMAALGIVVYNNDGTLRSHRQIIESVTGALSRLTPEAKNAAVQTIFGSDAQRAANIVFGAGAEKADALAKRLAGAAGAAETLAAKSKGLAGAQDAYNSSLESFEEKHASKFLNFFTEVVKGATNAIGAIDALIARMNAGSAGLTGILARANAIESDRQAGTIAAKLRMLDRAEAQVRDPNQGAMDLTTNNAFTAMFGKTPGNWSGSNGRTDAPRLLAEIARLRAELNREKANDDSETARLRGRQTRESKAKAGGKTPPAGTGGGEAAKVDTSPFLIEQQRLEGVKRAQEYQRGLAEKALGDAPSVEKVGKALLWLLDVSKKIEGTDAQLAGVGAKISGAGKDANPKVVEASRRRAVQDAEFDRRERDNAAKENATRRNRALEKEAEAEKKRRQGEQERADEKKAEASRTMRADELAAQLTSEKEEQTKAEAKYKLALDAIKAALTGEELDKAVASASALSKEVSDWAAKVSRTTKELADKRDGKETKENVSAYLAATKPGGENDRAMLDRNGEIAASAGEKRAGWKKDALEAAKKLEDELSKVTQDIPSAIKDLLDTQLAAARAAIEKEPSRAKKSLLVQAWKQLKKTIDQATANEIVDKATQAREALSAAIDKATDPDAKARLEAALKAFDSQEQTFTDEKGREITVRGGVPIATRIAASRLNAMDQQTDGEAKELSGKTRRALNGIALSAAVAGAGGSAADAAMSGGNGLDALKSSLGDAVRQGVRGELERGLDRMAQAFLSGTDEQKKAAGAQLMAAIQLSASASTLAALAGQRGKGQQGLAIAGALAGLYFGDKAGIRGEKLGGIATAGASLLTGNVLGAVLGLGSIKGLKLPKFATGGRMTGGSMTPIPGGAGIVLDGHKPEIFVPDAPGYVLSDASAAMNRLRDSLSGDDGSRSINQPININHYGDVNDAADRRYFDEKLRTDLLDLVLSRGD